MQNLVWSTAEKKLARAAFDKALQIELNSLIVEFKANANSVESVETIWEIRAWLNDRQMKIEHTYDFRYSQLIHVFARLIQLQRLQIEDLAGLDSKKIDMINLIVSMS
jgi:hypothetical protein